MSGFTRDLGRYGDRLVYEALQTKWDRYHARCGCGRDWVEAHAIPAGFTVVDEGPGWVALTGTGLTEDVDEAQLTANALWEAVTGHPRHPKLVRAHPLSGPEVWKCTRGNHPSPAARDSSSRYTWHRPS